MPLSSQLASLLPRILLALCVAELGIYRLLVPGLRPKLHQTPPLWHTALSYLGLFLFYFASILALCVVAHQLSEIWNKRDRYNKFATPILLLFGGAFLVLAALSILARPSASVTFLLETSFILSILTLGICQFFRSSEWGGRLGVWLLIAPLAIHFYASLSLHYIHGEEASWNGLIEQIEQAGRWMVLLSALLIPYCLGARPFVYKSARALPLMASLAVGLLGALIVRHDYAQGMKLAQNGLGFSMGPAAPESLVALSLLALSAMTWTIVNCLTTDSQARRSIGVGLSLIVVGGYGFAWPLQYLSSLAGFFTIARAASHVRGEEQSGIYSLGLPSISDDTWKKFLHKLANALTPETEEPANCLTVPGQGGEMRSHMAFRRKGIPVAITVKRVHGSVIGMDIRCGEMEDSQPPVWTLYPRSSDGPTHPKPPEISGRLHTGHASSLDERFDILDSIGWSENLLQAPVDHELIQQIEGWMAIWPEGGLRFQVYPGRSASLNSPLPLQALAQEQESSTLPMEELLNTLLCLCERAHLLAEGGQLNSEESDNEESNNEQQEAG